MSFTVPPIITAMARDRELTGRDVQLFLVACEHLDMIDFREMKLVVLEHELQLERSSISRSLTKLVNRGYLVRASGRAKGAPHRYRIPFSRAAVADDVDEVSEQHGPVVQAHDVPPLPAARRSRGMISRGVG